MSFPVHDVPTGQGGTEDGTKRGHLTGHTPVSPCLSSVDEGFSNTGHKGHLDSISIGSCGVLLVEPRHTCRPDDIAPGLAVSRDANGP